MTLGKNGKQMGDEYLQRAQAWKACIEATGKAHEYSYAGRVKRTEVARECGFSRSVCVQNKGVKALLECCDREWFGTEPADKTRSNAEIQAQVVFSDSDKLIARVTELESENKALRKQLSRYRALEEAIHEGMVGFEVKP
ncbi:hypothetical protein [Vreelandella profundi]|uniref:hypothetical protein n=1 Tax=Vreelandella profundi TaxID=2852117 RepID=UPI001EF03893|nr:hypothetical protein [Halomonas profundi]